jgi:hypothetical protein
VAGTAVERGATLVISGNSSELFRAVIFAVGVVANRSAAMGDESKSRHREQRRVK